MSSTGLPPKKNNSEVTDHGRGFRRVHTPGWEWNSEDVGLVLKAHGKVSSGLELESPLVQHCFDLCVAEERRIQKAVLYYSAMDAQIDSFFNEVETILFEHGVLSGEKIYFAPPEEDSSDAWKDEEE